MMTEFFYFPFGWSIPLNSTYCKYITFHRGERGTLATFDFTNINSDWNEFLHPEPLLYCTFSTFKCLVLIFLCRHVNNPDISSLWCLGSHVTLIYTESVWYSICLILNTDANLLSKVTLDLSFFFSAVSRCVSLDLSLTRWKWTCTVPAEDVTVPEIDDALATALETPHMSV